MNVRRTCDGCGAAVLWIRSAVSPAIMILDAEPVATGTITINAAGRAVVAADLATGDLFAPVPVPEVRCACALGVVDQRTPGTCGRCARPLREPRYRDHHATCTNPPRRGRR